MNSKGHPLESSTNETDPAPIIETESNGDVELRFGRRPLNRRTVGPFVQSVGAIAAYIIVVEVLGFKATSGFFAWTAPVLVILFSLVQLCRGLRLALERSVVTIGTSSMTIRRSFFGREVLLECEFRHLESIEAEVPEMDGHVTRPHAWLKRKGIEIGNNLRVFTDDGQSEIAFRNYPRPWLVAIGNRMESLIEESQSGHPVQSPSEVEASQRVEAERYATEEGWAERRRAAGARREARLLPEDIDWNAAIIKLHFRQAPWRFWSDERGWKVAIIGIALTLVAIFLPIGCLGLSIPIWIAWVSYVGALWLQSKRWANIRVTARQCRIHERRSVRIVNSVWDYESIVGVGIDTQPAIGIWTTERPHALKITLASGSSYEVAACASNEEKKALAAILTELLGVGGGTGAPMHESAE